MIHFVMLITCSIFQKNEKKSVKNGKKPLTNGRLNINLMHETVEWVQYRSSSLQSNGCNALTITTNCILNGFFDYFAHIVNDKLILTKWNENTNIRNIYYSHGMKRK